MKTIWKYELNADDEIILNIPPKSKILKLDVQRDKPFLWILIDKKEVEKGAVEKLRIKIYGTGHTIKDAENFEYLDSFMLFDGNFVGHVFVEKNKCFQLERLHK